MARHRMCSSYFSKHFITVDILYSLFFDCSLTVKAAPHECVIRTGQP